MDELEFMLCLWHEVIDCMPIDHASTEELFDTVEPYLWTDCKSLYDALTWIEASGLQLNEKRTAIEVLCLKQRNRNKWFRHKWISGDQNLADGLTKLAVSSLDALLRAVRLGRWRIVYDPSFVSAKKKSA